MAEGGGGGCLKKESLISHKNPTKFYPKKTDAKIRSILDPKIRPAFDRRLQSLARGQVFRVRLSLQNSIEKETQKYTVRD